MWQVPGFLLITGYFGTRFSPSKILRLLGVVYGCYWLTIPFRWGEETLQSLLLPHGGWFVPFYCALMVLSPILNAALENARPGGFVLPVVLLLVGGWIPTLGAGVHFNMMRIAGLQGAGVLLMLGTYFCGRFVKECGVFHKGYVWQWGCLFAIGIITMSLFGTLLCSNGYASPFVTATSVCGLVFFLHLPKISGNLETLVNFISPSMFGVYVLHECCIKELQYLRGGGGFH